jgi:hypothetical protein
MKNMPSSPKSFYPNHSTQTVMSAAALFRKKSANAPLPALLANLRAGTNKGLSFRKFTIDLVPFFPKILQLEGGNCRDRYLPN